MERISFLIEGNPPRTTKQMKRIIVRKIKGKMVGLHVDTPEIEEATAYYQEKLLPHRPESPLLGPLQIKILWVFPHLASRSKKDILQTIPKDTAPDCDNMAKLLLDTMQSMGFFANDGQIATETLEKFWGPVPGIHVELSQIQ